MMKLKVIILIGFLHCFIAFTQTYAVVKVEVICDVVPTELPINSDANEFSPFVVDNVLYFASDRDPDVYMQGENNWSNLKHINLYRSEFKGEVVNEPKYKTAQLLSERFAVGTHTGPACFSTTGDTIFLSQIVVDAKKGTFRPQLYYAIKFNNRYSKLVKVPFNNADFTYAHPYYESKSQRLYFSSDQAGGVGGFDIYYSQLSDLGWGNPIPVTEVNTAHNETFPYIRDKILYFSSNRKDPKKGLDVYWEILDGIAGANYLDGLNTEFDDFGICLVPSGKQGFLSSNRNGNDDIFLFNIEQKITVRNELAGEFVFRKLNGIPSEILVQIVDENNFVLYQTKTNSEGQFVFNDVNYDGNFSIKAVTDEDVKLTIFDQDKQAQGTLVKDDANRFVYREISAENSGTLSLIPENMIDYKLSLGHLTAQVIYESKPGTYPVNNKIRLVDADGKTAFQTVTDKNGNFEFTKIPMSKNYILQIDDYDEDMLLLIYDLKGNVVAELKTNEKGEFTYRKLSPDVNNQLSVEEDKIELFDMNSQTIWGYFEYESDKKLNRAGLIVKAYSENGVLIAMQSTDEKGLFRFRDLPIDRSLLFTLEGVDEEFDLDNFILYIFDRNGQKIAGLRRGQDGYFYYRPLGYDTKYELSQIELDNLNFILGNQKNRGRILVYFDSNQSQVKSEDLKILNNIYTVLVKNPDAKVEINAYADSKATDEYNLILSEKRGQWIVEYLIKKGIKADRIIVNAYGESQLIDNTNDALNRRAEIHIY